MYTLLEAPRNTQRARFTLFGMNYVSQALEANVERMTKRVRDTSHHVSSTHIVSRILHLLGVTFDGDFEKYRVTVEQKLPYICGILGITTAQHRGRIHTPGSFYPKGVVETYAGVETDFFMPDFEENWRSYNPIRVVTHPMDDVSTEYLDGRGDPTIKGIAVIEINIPMLACHYQKWVLEDESADFDITENVYNYIAMWILPSMVKSHIDVAIFNRLTKIYYNRPFTPNTRKLPWFQVDVTSQLDTVLERCIDRLLKTTLDPEDIMENVPAVFVANGLITAKSPDIRVTTQSAWLHALSKLPYVSFVIRVLTDRREEDPIGIPFKTKVRRWLIQIESNKTMINQVHPDITRWIDKVVDQDIMPYL